MENNIFTDLMKMVAVNFATWMEDNSWVVVYSEELKIRAYVDGLKNDVLVNGSDYHYTKLINEHGKTLEELYEMFLVDERERLKKEKENNESQVGQG